MVLGSTRYSTPPDPLRSHPPRVHLPPDTASSVLLACSAVRAARSNSVVGLISVAQLTSSPLFSGFLGITEVYNLVYVGRINNHSVITGNE